MQKEFTGKTEKEAIDAAILSLGLDRNDIDVEIVERQKSGIFKKGMVKIRVHVTEEFGKDYEPVEPEGEFERKVMGFTYTVIEKMGMRARVFLYLRDERRLGVAVDCDNSAILIGKRGKNLDALQLLANVYAGRIAEDPPRIVVDTENYRSRREDSLVRFAVRTAEQVRRSRKSRLLEPMNPFERRLVHTALNEMEGVSTKSEGEGLYKQVRVLYDPDKRLSSIPHGLPEDEGEE